jgi:hypothetical protein
MKGGKGGPYNRGNSVKHLYIWWSLSSYSEFSSRLMD